jgi:hypothetical protein
LITGAGVFIIPVLVSPLPNFKAPLSTVVEARDGSLLGARIAADGQWRFPASGKVPEKFKKALLTFEDRYFFYHPGDIIFDECFQTKYLIWSFKQAQYSCGDSVYYLRNGRLSAGRLFPGPCLPKIFHIWAGSLQRYLLSGYY